MEHPVYRGSADPEDFPSVSLSRKSSGNGTSLGITPLIAASTEPEHPFLPTSPPYLLRLKVKERGKRKGLRKCGR